MGQKVTEEKYTAEEAINLLLKAYSTQQEQIDRITRDLQQLTDKYKRDHGDYGND